MGIPGNFPSTRCHPNPLMTSIKTSLDLLSLTVPSLTQPSSSLILLLLPFCPPFLPIHSGDLLLFPFPGASMYVSLLGSPCHLGSQGLWIVTWSSFSLRLIFTYEWVWVTLTQDVGFQYLLRTSWLGHVINNVRHPPTLSCSSPNPHMLVYGGN